ncbi:MAG: hypothetical protein J6T64_11040 [Bacteroidaceae bacterium]|nr:hypothetical protein [Bacteroidaceae bacterium]
MPTANEFEWIRRQRCSFCSSSQPTAGHGKVYCTRFFQTVSRRACCAFHRYRPAIYALLVKEYPLTREEKPTTP